jgi:Family of unknown function (DUF6317)
MSDGFQVVMSDLHEASVTFGQEAQTFKTIMPNGGPVCPDGGSGQFDSTLHDAVQLLSLLHLQMTAVIDKHSEKLQAAHDNYDHTETSLAGLARDITLPGTV